MLLLPCRTPGICVRSFPIHDSSSLWKVWLMLWNILKQFETYWNTLNHIETSWNILNHIETYWNIWKHLQCNILSKSSASPWRQNTIFIPRGRRYLFCQFFSSSWFFILIQNKSQELATIAQPKRFALHPTFTHQFPWEKLLIYANSQNIAEDRSRMVLHNENLVLEVNSYEIFWHYLLQT